MPPRKRPAGAHAPPAKKSARTTNTAASVAPTTQCPPRAAPTAAQAFQQLIQASPLKEVEVDDAKVEITTTDVASTSGAKRRSSPGRGVNNDDGLQEHLALLTHGMVLVTLTEKAQQGLVSRAQLDEYVDQLGADEANAADGQHVKLFMPSVRADARWLEAVTRYCNRRVTLDDVARVAAACPTWLSASWELQQSSRQADWVLAAALTDGFSTNTAHQPLPPPQRKAAPSAAKAASGTATSSSKQRQGREGSALPHGVPAHEVLIARVRILVPRVPSVAEALDAIKAARIAFSKAQSVTPSAETWRDRMVRCSAYEAFVQQERQQGAHAAEPTALDPKGERVTHSVASREPTFAETEPDETNAEFTETEEAMLLTLSKELRQSLSKAKLRGVLAEMRKEASQAELHAFARIARQQEEERVLSTYTHVRSLFGATKTHLSAVRLIEALETENRFDDQRNGATQLSLLLRLNGSGLSAVGFPNAGDADNSADLLPAVPQPLDDANLSNEEALRRTLIYLDREKSSLLSVQESLKALQGPALTHHTTDGGKVDRTETRAGEGTSSSRA